MRRIAIAVLAAAAGAFGVAQAGAAPTCTTTAVANGDWAVPSTWSAGVPAAGVDACIPAGITVTIGSSTMAGPGTTTIQDGGRLAVVNYPTLSDGRVLDIEPTGVLELAADNRYVSRSGTVAPLIRNRGTIVRTAAGANDADLRLPVENDGSVVANTGRLVLSGGGTGSSGSYGGGAGTVELGGGVHELADGADLLGGVHLTAGELTVASSATVAATGANLVSGGTVGGPGALSVDGGTLTWSGGTMRGPGTTTVKPGATLANTGYTTLSDGRLVANQGIFALATDNRYVSRSGTTPPLIQNTGTIRRTVAGTSDTDLRVPVENDGLVTSDTGRLVLSGGGGESTGTYGGGAGVVELGGGTHALGAGAALAGGVELTAGELTVASGTAASTGANRITGGTLGGPGGLSVDTGSLTWSGGTMRGPGTTTVKAGATLANTGYTTLSEGRELLNQGTFELPTDNRYVSRSGAVPVIRNTGTIRRTATGTVGVDLRLPVENDGTVVSDGGPLTLSNGGAGGSSGTFGGGAGQVRLSTGTWQLADGSELQDGAALANNTTVTVADGATATASGAITMTGGAVTGAGTLAIAPAAVFGWSGGSMGGTGTTAVAAGGAIELTGGGSVSLGGSRTLDVAGLLDFKADSGMGLAATGATPLLRIAPGGTMRKSGGTLWSYVSVPVRNEGTADGQAGELILTEGSAQPHSGLFTGKSAAEHVVLGGDGHVLTGAARLEDFTEIDGDVSVRPGDTVTIAGEAQQTGGELSGDVAVTGTLHWSGGSHELPGSTRISASGRILVTSLQGQSCATASLGDGRRLDVLGLLRLGGGADLYAFGDPDRAEIHNAGRIELDSGDGSCGSSSGIIGDALVANAPGATIEKVAGAGDSAVSNLDNDGTLLNAAAGALRIDSSAASGHAGVFRATGAGPVAFDYGDFVFEQGATLDGDLAVTGAELRLPEGVTLDVGDGDTLELASGRIAGAGDVRIAGALSWTGGRQEGPGATLVEAGGTVSVAPAEGDDTAYALVTASRSLVNRGTMTVEDASLGVQDGASVLNRGTLELRDASELEGYSFGSGFDSLVHNTGVLRKTGTSASDARVPVDNDGSVEVDAGSLELFELVNWGGIGFLGDSGIAGGEYVVRGTLVVPGAMTANAARLVLDGAASKVVHRTGLGAQADALPSLARNAGGGELVLRGGRSLSVSGPFTNQGVLDLGAGSTLATKGFRQASGAVLRPAVTSGGVGRVAATDAAALGGRLDTPAAPALAGDHLVLSAPSVSGAFSAVSGGYAAHVSATEVRLRPPAGGKRTAGSPGDDAGTFGASAPAPSATAGEGPAASLGIDGPWQRRRAVLAATRRGARLTVPAVRGRELALVVRTCRRCGAVRVRWAGRGRTISLAGRPGRRTIRVFALRRTRSAAVRLTTASKRRVVVRALLVRP